MSDAKDEFDELNERIASREELEEMLERSEFNQDLQERMQALYSKQLFTRYEKLIEAGFDEGMAFTIIVHRGLG